MKYIILAFVLYLLVFKVSVLKSQETLLTKKIITSKDIKTGADQTEEYVPLLKNKNIAIVANQTSMIRNTHLVDSLLHLNLRIKKVFCPEHGFRGDQDAGALINNEIDAKTGLQIISLYGKNKKPRVSDLKDINVVIFDIQDVGARFYTYISTLHYVMEACAENKIELIVFDRPNPNGYYIDGPVLDMKYTSFVGMHPVPIVHGLTIGEYAHMINGEKWLANKLKCKLTVIPVFNYNHSNYYILPVKPSPNLLNMKSVYLYPTLCLFEGTVVSVGRGTFKPFEVVGHPLLQNADTFFIPESIKGMSENPPYINQKCFGYNLSDFSVTYLRMEGKLNLFWITEMYKKLSPKTVFFNDFFNKLVGNGILKQQIIDGVKEEDIRKSWEKDLMMYKKIRKKYLLYPDFE